MDEALSAYEDSVLALACEHGGTVLQRARSNGSADLPREIQIYEWESQAAMDGYMSDPRRLALAGERERVVARTEILPVQLIEG
jgi:hypothetical protein